MAKQYVHYFTVGGAYYFPMDMLRYDSCWPSTSEDASQLQFHPQRNSDVETKRKIRLVTIGHKERRPTLDRWKSFGWEVIHYEKGTEVY